MDPIGFRGKNTNLYGYVFNSPLMYFDPLGMVDVSQVFFGTLEVVGGVGLICVGVAGAAGTLGIGAGATAVAGIAGATSAAHGISSIIAGIIDKDGSIPELPSADIPVNAFLIASGGDRDFADKCDLVILLTNAGGKQIGGIMKHNMTPGKAADSLNDLLRSINTTNHKNDDDE
ncbi:hypothetical protein [Oceanidesulfovibrio indonesiensis]|uniref:hypothetical protein n=1 Tax=Oceanidesulfovibrio indonesiensis TaxID=54767 RepID=UPI0011865CE2|nr:hypothetical protein [Oceanidesulfovibrio indonesiensis]